MKLSHYSGQKVSMLTNQLLYPWILNRNLELATLCLRKLRILNSACASLNHQYSLNLLSQHFLSSIRHSSCLRIRYHLTIIMDMFAREWWTLYFMLGFGSYLSI